MNMMKLIEFGDCPPPFGGVSVHFQRLLHRLQRDKFEVTHIGRRAASSCAVTSFVRWPTLPRYINHFEFIRGVASPFGEGVLHLHDNPVFFAPLVALHVLRGGKALITVHNQMLLSLLSKALLHEQMAFRWITKSPSIQWIAVSRNVREILLQQGVSGDRISVIPAFLAQEEGTTGSALPPGVQRFLTSHDPNMVVYGYKRDFWDGKDLYGFDYSIMVLREILKAAPNAGLIILCPDAHNYADTWEPLMNEVELLGMKGQVLFLLEPMQEPLALWKNCSIMLRPTVTDGDSVAVREMLALGRPVVASNSAPRPDGVQVLALESPAEWARVVLECVNVDALPGRTVRPFESDGYEQIKRVLFKLAVVAD